MSSSCQQSLGLGIAGRARTSDVTLGENICVWGTTSLMGIEDRHKPTLRKYILEGLPALCLWKLPSTRLIKWKKLEAHAHTEKWCGHQDHYTRSFCVRAPRCF